MWQLLKIGKNVKRKWKKIRFMELRGICSVCTSSIFFPIIKETWFKIFELNLKPGKKHHFKKYIVLLGCIAFHYIFCQKIFIFLGNLSCCLGWSFIWCLITASSISINCNLLILKHFLSFRLFTAVTWGIMGLSCLRKGVDGLNFNIKVFVAVPDMCFSPFLMPNWNVRWLVCDSQRSKQAASGHSHIFQQLLVFFGFHL